MKKIAWISLFLGTSLFILTFYLSITHRIANNDMLIWLILSFVFSFIGSSLIWQSKPYEKKIILRKYLLFILVVLLDLTLISYFFEEFFHWFYLISILYFSFGITPLNASIRIIKWSNYVDSKLTLKLLCYADHLGIIFLAIGLAWKTLHWPLANQMTIIGVVLLIFAAIAWNKVFRNQINFRIVAENALKLKNKEIMDSINYAKRIQHSFLASENLLKQNLNDYFIYFNPKEAVSGDFYWADNFDNGNFALCCADSTGHGVPGAIMSILNISSIEKACEKSVLNPSEIFNQARDLIIERLKKDGSVHGGKDGMDATLLLFNPAKTKLEYVAANNPIWIIREGELIDIKGEKMPVGKHDHDHIPFKGGEFELKNGDTIYTMTDGFQDQFGGEKGKKFKVIPMKRMLLENNHLSMAEQHQLIAKTFEEWKGNNEQVDDVCLIGIRI